jgi:hypothetical protein
MANQNVSNMLHGVANQTAMLNNLFSIVMLNAETVAYNDVFRLCAVLFVLAVPTVFLLRKTSVSGAPVESVVE